MTPDILQLYPPSDTRHTLQGLYLDQKIRQQPADKDVFVYANFIASLDGRIALPAPGRKTHQVPAAIGNARDWRLYQELAAQADVLITSARFFRQTAVNEAQDTLPVGGAKAFADLRRWRTEQGLLAQPDIIIFSASLDIPVTSLTAYAQRRITILTGEQSDPGRRSKLQSETAADVISCGQQRGVDGQLVRAVLSQLGYQFVYAIAGPSVFNTLVTGDALDRLYLTTAHRLLGGSEFDTFNNGTEHLPAVDMPLQSLYYDPSAPENAGQTLAVYGC